MVLLNLKTKNKETVYIYNHINYLQPRGITKYTVYSPSILIALIQ